MDEFSIENKDALEIVAYEKDEQLCLGNDEIVVGDTVIPNKEILLINRYLEIKGVIGTPKYAVVYRCSPTEVAMCEFSPNIKFKDQDLDTKLSNWAYAQKITIEENDWNYCNPIKNGYKTYAYHETHAQPQRKSGENKLIALGLTIAGALVIVVCSVLLALGKTSFGGMGIVIGMVAMVFGCTGIASARKKK